ncbi:MAG: hypothetical protein HY331_00785 [Chloroflexi bacterium]|nr:hypothetical protein [Chloroflexota bacterium]
MVRDGSEATPEAAFAPVAVTAYFTVDGRCRPLSLVLRGEVVPVTEVLLERMEEDEYDWLVQTADATYELHFDAFELRWSARVARLLA